MNKRGQAQDHTDFLIAIIIVVLILLFTVPAANRKTANRYLVISGVEGKTYQDNLFNFLRYESGGKKVSSYLVDYCNKGDNSVFLGTDFPAIFSKVFILSDDPSGPFSTNEMWIVLECNERQLFIYPDHVSEKVKSEPKTPVYDKDIPQENQIMLPSDKGDIYVRFYSEFRYGGSV